MSILRDITIYLILHAEQND